MDRQENEEVWNTCKASERYQLSAERGSKRACKRRKNKRGDQGAVHRANDTERARETPRAQRARRQGKNLQHPPETTDDTGMMLAVADVELIEKYKRKQQQISWSAAEPGALVEEQERRNEGRRAGKQRSTSITYEALPPEKVWKCRLTRRVPMSSKYWENTRRAKKWTAARWRCLKNDRPYWYLHSSWNGIKTNNSSMQRTKASENPR